MSCRFDVVDFPYDTQICSMQYSSWMYTADSIALFHHVIIYSLLDYYVENDGTKLIFINHLNFI